MSFPPDVAEKALLDCGRHCCICHIFCGFKIELHHILPKSDRGEDSYENCIPLCFNCHAEVKAYDPKHPKGKKYTESELRGHRNRWYEKVNNTGYIILSDPNYIGLDRNLFIEIRQILPSTGSIARIRSHDFGEPFYKEELDDLYKFCDQRIRPEFEFIDIDLEGLRISLLNDIDNFLCLCEANTFPLNNGSELRCIPRDYNNYDYRKLMVRETNESVDKVCETYDNFIRLARRKLGV